MVMNFTDQLITAGLALLAFMQLVNWLIPTP